MNDYQEAQKAIGNANKELVRSMMIDCPGITNLEMAELSGIRHETIGKHKRAIRAEWLPIVPLASPDHRKAKA